MTWIFDRKHSIGHLVELLMNDPIVSKYCTHSANHELHRPCKDDEEYCDVDWWEAHNRALSDLLSDAAASIGR